MVQQSALPWLPFEILLGPVPNLGKSQFGDLLDPGMFSSQKPDDGPVSLRDLKKKNAVETAVDPDRARVSCFSSCCQQTSAGQIMS